MQITAYGHRFVRLDNYNKLDLVLVTSCIFQFVIQFGMHFIKTEDEIKAVLAASFIFVMSIRLVHAVKYVQVGTENKVAVLLYFITCSLCNTLKTAGRREDHAVASGRGSASVCCR